MKRAELIAASRRVVVKVGSGVLTSAQGLDTRRVAELAGQIARLLEGGRQVVLVSSGAVASGAAKLRPGFTPASIPEKQAAAALGQSRLMQAYEDAFAAHGVKVAQVLLTGADLHRRKRYLNARNTLFTLLDWGVLPIINENDTVAVAEIKLGDNDNLAATLTNLLAADLLINLTNVEGILDADPRANPGAELIPRVEKVTPELLKAASSQPGAVGRGGVLSKVKAAEKAARCGAATIVANGTVDGILDQLAAGDDRGTLFLPHDDPLTRRKAWIAFDSEPAGELVVDEGAVRPLCEKGKSLLAAGIVTVRGSFLAGAAVRVLGPGETVIGVGLSNYASEELGKIQGLRSDEIEGRLGYKDYDEVIHRDNLVMFDLEDEESVACLLSS
ncbi:MAG: glutamate 5-kinase [Desulfarculaceae bacterium]|nr:glutamate 5-kinase [Desulfarculaceae bacterium]MCF8071878.1 glutamate 5-kinase [Desulfarculaceae bacterium]MCF8101428.1 glutamate 5-kinase [Desulfarculaceae bacterium]MCF8117419.1 glutamate 5-kinase [Desulfarculaceae bacterium]